MLLSILQVYLTLCCALVASAAGAYLHLLWNIGGLLTTFACLGCMAWLLSLPPYEEVNSHIRKSFFGCLCVACFCYLLSSDFFFSVLFYEQQKRVALLMAAGLFEGASIGPLIDLAIEIDPRYFKFVATVFVFFFGIIIIRWEFWI